jgi:pyruvate formate lyase activating enzyme
VPQPAPWRRQEGHPARGTILDIQRFSIHDGPGIRTTVFFKGCPLSCWWCHNPESQAHSRELVTRQERCIGCGACENACTRGAIHLSGEGPAIARARCTSCGACMEVCYAEALEVVGREMTLAQVLAQLEKDVAFFDESGGGVTFSGGEPLSQPLFLLALLQACRAREIHTAVDTCGFAPWPVFEQIRQYVDLFLYDLKLLDDRQHQTYTGVSNEPILANLRRLSELEHQIILRLPLVPGVNDDAEQVRAIGALAARLPHLHRVDLLPYHHLAVEKYGRLDRSYSLPDARPPSAAWVAERVRILAGLGLEVRTGGENHGDE